MENKLIALYLLVCRLYDTEAVLKHQRLSNFRPRFTDEELLTMYLFGHFSGHTTHRAIYDYFARHWRQWFPAMPSYQAFNRRLNELVPSFELLIDNCLQSTLRQLPAASDRLVDSVPVILARAPRSARARVARELADKGFSASKGCYYYGVKLHLLAVRRRARLPVPQYAHISRASAHDLAALRQMNPRLGNCGLFGDKAYSDTDTADALRKQGTHLITPHKRRRGEPETSARTLWSRFVSSVRQPLESFFNFLIQTTDVQNASRVRSANGLLVHCYGKLAVACLLLTFDS